MFETRFLGTMAGIEEPTYSSVKKDLIYTRTYESEPAADKIRQDIASSALRMQEIGEDFSLQPSIRGGCYFATLEPATALLSRANYALSQYGQAIEDISGLNSKQLQVKTDAYSIRYIIYHYFESVTTTPQEGNLVFYPNPALPEIEPLVGIFKATVPNWNSPPGGTVVFKYQKNCTSLFQCDIFFNPLFYGNKAEFYRLKTQYVPLSISFNINPSIPPIPYTLIGDEFIYSSSQEADKLREDLSRTRTSLMHKFKQLHILDYIHFQGVCYHYAFGKFLKSYVAPSFTKAMANKQTLFKYFDSTIYPEKGDLAVYFNDKGHPVHYGIYLRENWIESKWGQEKVYRHTYFDVPKIYKNHLKFLRLKPGLTKKAFYFFNMRLDHKGRSSNAPIILNQDINGYKTLLLFSYKKPKMRIPERGDKKCLRP